MSSVYLYLGLLAVIFTTFGYLFHAFYFSGERDRRISAELDAMRRNLEQKQRAAKEAWDEAARTTAFARNLEQQVNQRNSEMETLRLLVLRQEEEIRQLRKDAAAVRLALSERGAGRYSEESISTFLREASENIAGLTGAVPGVTLPAEKEAAGPGSPPLKETRGRPGSGSVALPWFMGSQKKAPAAVEAEGVAGWKANLDSIISILEAMERDIQN